MFEMETGAFLPEVLSLWKIALPAIFLGCLLGNVLKDTALWLYLSKIMYPLARLGRLSRGSASFLALSLVNYYVAKTLLASLKRDGAIKDREIICSYLTSALPAGLHFLAFYIAPALVAALGWRLGMMYSVLYVLINAIICAAGLAVGRRSLTGEEARPQIAGDKAQPDSARQKINVHLIKAVKEFYRLAVVFVPVTLLSAALLHTPAAAEAIDGAAPLLEIVGLSAPSLLAIAAGIPSMMAGIGTLGSIVREGMLTDKEVLVTLLIASMLHSVYELCSGVMAGNVAIFGARLGFRLSVIAVALRLAASLAALALVLIVL